jgi:gas vesicle protein
LGAFSNQYLQEAKIMRFLAGFLIGMVLGFVAVLLVTPQSGQDLQQQAKSKFEGVMAEGRKAAADRRAELETRLANLKSA